SSTVLRLMRRIFSSSTRLLVQLGVLTWVLICRVLANGQASPLVLTANCTVRRITQAIFSSSTLLLVQPSAPTWVLICRRGVTPNGMASPLDQTGDSTVLLAWLHMF